MLVGNFYSASSNSSLTLYRVKKGFQTPNGVSWPVGVIRLWTLLEVNAARTNSLDEVGAKADPKFFDEHFEEVEWK